MEALLRAALLLGDFRRPVPVHEITISGFQIQNHVRKLYPRCKIVTHTRLQSSSAETILPDSPGENYLRVLCTPDLVSLGPTLPFILGHFQRISQKAIHQSVDRFAVGLGIGIYISFSSFIIRIGTSTAPTFKAYAEEWLKTYKIQILFPWFETRPMSITSRL